MRKLESRKDKQEYMSHRIYIMAFLSFIGSDKTLKVISYKFQIDHESLKTLVLD